MTRASHQRTLCSAFIVLLAVAYFFVAVANARADDPIPGQQASTEQTAGAIGSVTQQQPQNLVVTVRLDSPGSNGPIVQTNTGSALGSASNGATSDQSGGQDGNQSAATGQNAAAGATATQSGPQNIVIVIRVNSPGANGPIVQGNTAVADAAASNASATQQGAGPGSEKARRRAYARPHAASRPTPTAARGNARMRTRHAASTRARAQTSSSTYADPGLTQLAAASAVTPVKATSSPGRHAQRSAAARATPAHAPRAAGAAARAAAVLGKVAAGPQLAATDGAHDVSGPVLLALLAILGAALLAVFASRRAPSVEHVSVLRGWRHG